MVLSRGPCAPEVLVGVAVLAPSCFTNLSVKKEKKEERQIDFDARFDTLTMLLTTSKHWPTVGGSINPAFACLCFNFIID